MKFGTVLRRNAAACKRQVLTLWIAYHDPRTPWHAKVFLFLVVAYALSPIDLIPDFIPILGYLDDVVLIPLGVILAVKMVPEPVLMDSRIKAQAQIDQRLPGSRFGIWFVFSIWLIALVVVVGIGWSFLNEFFAGER